ncbi:kinase-like protein [Piedraia hortae CBS 480.64]|uniref:Kinase-like protein n=1 Tax=Piedraia hortae CBS 480.64 TaxID=1314780 RepID=A0A6A7BWR9_9PEZI|nr:kinase-like protein [Piedraia hortae CBS 480.64]
MATALGYLHEEKLVIHRDIKPEDMFLKFSTPDDVPPVLVLGDFGLSSPMNDTHGVSGSPGYFSPKCKQSLSLEEHARDKGVQTPKLDMYCFGAVLSCLLTSELFDNRREESKSHLLRPKLARAKAPDNTREFTIRCLSEQPEDRPETLEFVQLD